MMVNINKEKKMERENLLGQMDLSTIVYNKIDMKEILVKMIFMDMVFINGLMEEFMRESGNTIKWMDMENLFGQMADYIQEM